MTEHQILRKTHEMSMAASAYRAKHSEAQTVKLLIAGFTGSLKGWWDNYLTQDQRSYILNLRAANSNKLKVKYKLSKAYIFKKLIRPSKSPWSCAAFYVQNASEIERGEPMMVINYKPLNKVLKWIRYPLPNKS
uniref:Polyprotein n=1 Tax=Cajanus cajan TaxID=3821 RepID=A0A151RB01_CAJCA|nr:polyprotein [Cajanus cajan]